MSDLGDVGGEVVGMFIGIPMAIILVVSLPIMAIQKACSPEDTKPTPIVKKESLSFRAGQKVKESSKDFVRGVFTKTEK